MSRRLFVATVCALASVVCSAQVVRIERPASREPVSSQPKIDAQQRQRGLDMLKSAEAGAAGLDVGMRAWAQWQVARAYQEHDRRHAVELLQSALACTRSLDDDALDTRVLLQQRILADLVPLSPTAVDEALPTVDVKARGEVLAKMLAFYERSNNHDRAVELVYRLAVANEVPYDAVNRLMQPLDPQQSAEFLQLFSAALNSYASHRNRDFATRGFPELLVAYWKHLPNTVVLQSIDEILKQADPANQESSVQQTYSVSSSKGAASFNSIYEYRLFQLLPLLEQLDESRAHELLQRHRAVAGQLERYSQGMTSLTPDSPATPRGRDNAAGDITYSVSADSAITPFMAEVGRMQKFVEEAESGHTEDALYHASSLSNLQLRGGCYHNIARVTMKKYPDVARTAIQRMIEVAPGITDALQPPPFFELMAFRAAADVYLLIGDEEAARKAIRKGLDLAAKLREIEASADDPNKALKAFWVSTDSYRALLRQAAKISPSWAMELLKELPDPEIKVVTQVSVATTWLGISPGQALIMSDRKSNRGTMTGGIEAEE